MEYMNLSDEEILEAIKIARDISAQKGTAFPIAIQGALEVMVEERKKREEEILAENPMYVQEEPVIGENNPYSDAPQIGPGTIPYELLDTYFHKNLKDIEESISVAKRYMDAGERENAEHFLQMAYKGVLTPDSLKKGLGYIPEALRDELGQFVNDANNLMRENYYIYCTYAPDEELERDRREAISKYTELRTLGIKNYVKNEDGKLWGSNSTDNYESEKAYYDEWYDTKARGISVDPDGYFLTFDPVSFDQDYGYAEEQITATGPKLNIVKFQKARESISNRIEMLGKMSVAEYREYKLSQMKLTNEEKMMYDQHFQEFVMQNKVSIGRGR